MLTPKHPLEQFPDLKSSPKNFLDFKSYRTLCWKRVLTEQILVLLAIMVAIAMGKAQTSTVLWPELAIGTYLVFFRSARSLFAVGLGECIGLLLHHFNVLNALSIVAVDLAFILTLYLCLRFWIDKIIAFQSLSSKIIFYLSTLIMLTPYSIVMSQILKHHHSSLAIWLANSFAFASLLPAAFIWDRYIPQKNQIKHQGFFVALILLACILQIFTIVFSSRIFLIVDAVMMISLLIFTHKIWGKYGSSLLLAVSALTLALTWHGQ